VNNDFQQLISDPVANRIAELVKGISGWTPADELLALHALALATSSVGGDVLEVGSWCGRSASVLGHAVKLTGVGHVWAVDLFPDIEDWNENPDGTYSLAVRVNNILVKSFVSNPLWQDPFRAVVAPVYSDSANLLQLFERNIALQGLSNWVTAFKGTVGMFVAGRSPDLRIRLAFVDGDHDYEAVSRDIAAIETVLVGGGWIAFDDAFGAYAGVTRAVQYHIIDSGRYELAHQLCRKLFIARRKHT
jgi:hypothetical protein